MGKYQLETTKTGGKFMIRLPWRDKPWMIQYGGTYANNRLEDLNRAYEHGFKDGQIALSQRVMAEAKLPGFRPAEERT